MRIAINCRSILRPSRTGIGRYAYHLIDSLGKIDTENDYALYAPKDFFDFKRRLPVFPYPHFKRVIDRLRQGPQRLLKGAHLYHVPSPDLVEPLAGAKLIVTIHDLIYKTYPQSHTAETLESTARQMETIVRHADKIICTSTNTRTDLHRYFDLSQQKTNVVYNGVDHQVFYVLDDGARAQQRKTLPALGISKPFILSVGTLEPRKNLKGLLRSFALLKSAKAFDGQLVVVGMKGWMTGEIMPLIKELGLSVQDIVFTGFITDDQLCVLYNLAEVFIFPSFYEGFGFPIVEAFACGAAVVASSTSSCGEIAQDAAVLINPQSPEEISKAIGELLNNPKLNAQYRQRARQRGQAFSFIQTARETLNIYLSA